MGSSWTIPYRRPCSTPSRWWTRTFPSIALPTCSPGKRRPRWCGATASSWASSTGTTCCARWRAFAEEPPLQPLLHLPEDELSLRLVEHLVIKAVPTQELRQVGGRPRRPPARGLGVHHAVRARDHDQGGPAEVAGPCLHPLLDTEHLREPADRDLVADQGIGGVGRHHLGIPRELSGVEVVGEA